MLGTFLVVHLGRRVENVEHGVRERGLLGAGLASRHVQLGWRFMRPVLMHTRSPVPRLVS